MVEEHVPISERRGLTQSSQLNPWVEYQEVTTKYVSSYTLKEDATTLSGLHTESPRNIKSVMREAYGSKIPIYLSQNHIMFGMSKI